MIRFICAAGLLAAAMPSEAGFVKSTYTEFAAHMASNMDRIAQDMQLSAPEQESAEQAAALFFLFGPCRGSVTPDPRTSGLPSIGMAGQHDLTGGKTNTAISAYIGLFARQYDLGRTPGEFNCRLAADKAYPALPIRYTVRACFVPRTEAPDGDEVCVQVR